MFKKIVSLFLIGIVAINLFGYLISFTVQRYHVRQLVKQTLREQKVKNAVQFVFTEIEYAQLDKYDGGREFSFKGNMYDVLRMQKKEESIIVTAFFDKRETGLLDAFTAFFEEDIPHDSRETLRQFNLLEFVFVYTNWQPHVACYHFFLTYYKSSLPISAAISQDTPPPDFWMA